MVVDWSVGNRQWFSSMEVLVGGFHFISEVVIYRVVHRCIGGCMSVALDYVRDTTWDCYWGAGAGFIVWCGGDLPEA